MTYTDIDAMVDAYNREVHALEETVARFVQRRGAIEDVARERVILKYLRPRFARISVRVTVPADGWPDDPEAEAKAATDDLLTIPEPLRRCKDAP